MRPIVQRGETALLVTTQPVVDALAGYTEGIGDLLNSPTIPDHSQHSLVTLLHPADLQQHSGHLLRLATKPSEAAQRVSNINRNPVKDQPKPRKTSAEADLEKISRGNTQTSAPPGIRTRNLRIKSPLLCR